MKNIFFILFLAILLNSLHAQTYYVSTSGSDSNDGLSQSTPWQSFIYAEAHATTPGCTIALKRGDVWSTTLTLGIHHGGNAGNPITWDGGLWGTGPNAVIQTSATRVHPDYSLVNIIGCSYVNFQNFTVNGNHFETFGIVIGGYEDDRFSPNSHQSNESYITVQDCLIKDIGDNLHYVNGITVSVYNTNCHNITIRRNVINGTGAHSISLYPATEVYQPGHSGHSIRDSYIGYNTCTNYRLFSGNTGYGIHINHKDTNILVEHNTVIDSIGTNHCVVIDGFNLDASMGYVSQGIVIRYNIIRAKYGAAIYSQAGGPKRAEIYGNLITNLGGTGTRFGIYFIGNQISYTGAKFNIYNNTIVLDGGRAFYDGTDTVDVTTFRNNIIFNSGTQACIQSLGNNTMTHSNNLFFNPGGGDLLYIVNAGSYVYKSGLAGWEPSAKNADPIFSNMAGLNYRLQNGSPAIKAGLLISDTLTDIDTVQYSVPPSVGCYENAPNLIAPQYVNSQISDIARSSLVMKFDLKLDSTSVPVTSAFDVKVNSLSRGVTNVSVKDTIVTLTLASPALAGDIITVAFTKQLTNTLKSSAGKAVASFYAKPVTNNIINHAPIYISSVVQDATPALLEMTYDKTINGGIIPSTSTFNVIVNSVKRNVLSINIAGSKIQLNLITPIVNGDIVTVDYSQPGSNPLQGSSGDVIANLTGASVVNNCFSVVYIVDPAFTSAVIEDATPNIIELRFDLALNSDTLPPLTAFNILVNNISRGLLSASISGNAVLLTFSSKVNFGDTVLLSYTKPPQFELQTPEGGIAGNIINQSVSNNVNSVVSIYNPIFQNSVVEDQLPAQIIMNYDRNLDSTIIPPATAFVVKVNFNQATINSVKIQGKQVQLMLSNGVVYGDNVTVAYTKPATNEMQTDSGGIAATIGDKPVTNNVKQVIVIVDPVYGSSSIENATPKLLQLNYNLALESSIVPSASAYAVLVNSIPINVTSVSINGSSVFLTLASPVAYGDIVTIAYTKPGVNPLQTSLGGEAASFSSFPVSNNIAQIIVIVPNDTVIISPPVAVVKYDSVAYSGFVYQMDASQSKDSNNLTLSYSWTTPDSVPLSSTNSSMIQFLAPIVAGSKNINFMLHVSNGAAESIKHITVKVNAYKPELTPAEIMNVEASDYVVPDYPSNAVDDKPETYWSSSGLDEWLLLHLKDPYSTDYLALAFLPGQKKESYFDVYASKDSLNWETLIQDASSCTFSGNEQVFNFPPELTDSVFSYFKIIAKGSSEDSWNNFSELKIFGVAHPIPPPPPPPPPTTEFGIYPNPASNSVTVLIASDSIKSSYTIRIFDYRGGLAYEKEFSSDVSSVNIPIDFRSGEYIVDIISSGEIVSVQKLLVIRPKR